MNIERQPEIATRRDRIADLQQQIADLKELCERERNRERRILMLREIRDLTQEVFNLEREITQIIEGWNANLEAALHIMENRGKR